MTPTPPSRFAINVPAAIGVAVVFVVAVAAWVVASQIGGDEVTRSDRTIPPASLVSDPPTVPAPTTVSAPITVPDPTAAPDGTSPIPLPTNVPQQGVTTTTTAGTQSGPTTTAGAAVTTTVAPTVSVQGSGEGQIGGAGDLGVEGRPIQQPTCDGAFVTVIASVIGDDEAAAFSVSKQLTAHPDANYLRTDQSCSSFRPSVDGRPIYVVYLGPFAQPGDACAARPGADSYVKRLTNGDDQGPGCSTG